MPNSDKDSIRSRKRQERCALDSLLQVNAARGLARNLNTLDLFGSGNNIAFYIANDGEIDPGPAMHIAAADGVNCFLPIVPARGERLLQFAPVDQHTRFIPNRFGIPEPDVPAQCLIPAARLHWILVPLVAFDANGNRVGMGGGFYDTTLNEAAAAGDGPGVIGLAHELQKVDVIPSDHWDIPIQRIVTDISVYHCADPVA